MRFRPCHRSHQMALWLPLPPSSNSSLSAAKLEFTVTLSKLCQGLHRRMTVQVRRDWEVLATLISPGFPNTPGRHQKILFNLEADYYSTERYIPKLREVKQNLWYTRQFGI
jgi:hypothetical protein